MTKTRLYIARHGKTMFNTIGRAQGWSDTCLLYTSPSPRDYAASRMPSSA